MTKGESSQDQKRSTSWTNAKAKIIQIVTNITIEPAMTVIAFVSSLEVLTFKELTLYKTCINDFDFRDEICHDLLSDNYTEYNEAVQNEVRCLTSSLGAKLCSSISYD